MMIWTAFVNSVLEKTIVVIVIFAKIKDIGIFEYNSSITFYKHALLQIITKITEALVILSGQSDITWHFFLFLPILDPSLHTHISDNFHFQNTIFFKSVNSSKLKTGYYCLKREKKMFGWPSVSPMCYLVTLSRSSLLECHVLFEWPFT